MTSHPLFLTLYPLYLCHNIHCIDGMKPTEFLRSHLLYMMTSYPFYMTSKPLNVCYHTHCIDNFTSILCITPQSPCVASFALYKTSHPHFMTTNHRVYVITPTILTWCPLYLCHHIHSIDDITPTVFLRSHAL